MGVYVYIIISSDLACGFLMSNIRWSVVVPEATDRALRTYLARHGGKKGDISRFIDEAVQARLFELTVENVKKRKLRKRIEKL